MALDTVSPHSRRALLVGALGGLGAWVAGAVSRVSPASATDHQAVIQGEDNGGTLSTVVRVSTATSSLQGVSDATSGTSYGVRGRNSSTAGAGVLGVAASTTGTAAGVRGVTNSPGGRGVYGGASDSAAIGVVGESSSSIGVAGLSYAGGWGVYGASATTSGFAGYFEGRVHFSRSGRASVPINANYVDVTVTGGLTSSANVLALLQASRSGVWVRAVRTNYPTSGKARIYLNKVASTSVTTPVAWFVLG